MTRLVVLGGGVAGLSAWRRALARGFDATLVERCARPGGLTRSIHVGGFVFDYTGHFLHLARTSHPDQLGTARGAWRKVTRRAACLVAGRPVPAPFQYHLGALPEPARSECAEGVGALLARPEPVKPGPGEDLVAFFLRAFGPGVTDHFLRPYNEKLLATELSGLDAVRLNRFFPAPDPAAVKAGLSQAAGLSEAAGATYNATFWYPEGDGIGRLVDQLDPGATHVQAEVDAVDLEGRVVIAGGRELPYDHLVSTIPLPDLLRACGGQWADGAGRLAASGVTAFQLGVRGPVAPLLKDLHWLYVPDPGLVFFRVGCYSNVSAALAPRGCHSLYVEVGFAGAPPEPRALTDRVLADLVSAGLLADPSRVEVLLRHVLDPAYVRFDFDWSRTVPALLGGLEANGVHCAGRYGRWDYLGMEDVILDAAALVDRLATVGGHERG
jgi:protoporphyrinogen oxidase